MDRRHHLRTATVFGIACVSFVLLALLTPAASQSVRPTAVRHKVVEHGSLRAPVPRGHPLLHCSRGTTTPSNAVSVENSI